MKTRGLVYCLVVTLCLCAAWAQAQDTVYVSQEVTCGNHSPCYSTIQGAIDAFPPPSTIKITQGTYAEDVFLDANQLMALEGGWDTGFTSCSSYTVIRGSLTLVDGTTIIGGTGRIIVSPPLPTISGFSANPGSINSGSSSTLIWTITNATSASIDQGVGSVDPASGSTSVSPTTTTTYTLTATNAAGFVTAQATVTVIVLPTINVFSVDPATINLGESSTLSWTITNATSASIDQGVGSVNPASGSVSVSPTATSTYTLTATNAAGSVTAQITVTVTVVPPPDPATVAPPIDPTVATTVNTATSFLYTGPNPIQAGVVPGTIDVKRTAVLRGKVMTRDDQPLPGVIITILSHPEYGLTVSRLDGMFDMAVNGGGLLTINCEKNGYLPAQRQVNVPWQDFVWLPEVILIPVDTQVTTVDLTNPAPIQVARGNVVTDNAGSRQATLLLPSGTTATIVKPDGTTQPISTLNIRATEYTVGSNGPKAMPARLPPNSGYTYCVELSADEAISAGARSVQFSQPLFYYLENYLYAQVGSTVPAGYYDRVKGVWIPSDSGRVVKIISITGGLADVDTDGDGVADNGLGITEAERQYLATLYPADQELWRVPVPHFSPWDYNWAFGPPADATFPSQPPPTTKGDEADPCEAQSSIIGCQSQTLGEAIDIVGTPFRLHYQSERGYGRKAAYTLEIPLSGATVPGSLTGIDLEIQVAGRRFTHSLSRDVPCLHECPVLQLQLNPSSTCDPVPPPGNDVLTSQKYVFAWDGVNAYGQLLQGAQPITVRIGYTYCGSYQKTDKFGYYGAGMITGSRSAQTVTLWQEWKGFIGLFDARASGLGGWTLNVHSTYDPVGRVLFYGNGRRRNAEPITNTIATVAGTGIAGYSGDGGPATDAKLYSPYGVAVGPDGSLYIADYNNSRIRRVGPDGIISTVAGTGVAGYSGDGGPATSARLSGPWSVAVGPDGNIYIGDDGGCIRRVGPDGIITTVAGTFGQYGYSGDGGPATSAKLNAPWGVAVGPDGSLYIADMYNNRVRRVGPDGIITTIAGTGVGGYSGDGGPATNARLNQPTGVAVGADGSLCIADYGNSRIRRVGFDGIITTIAGTGLGGYSGDGDLATNAKLNGATGVAIGADGSLYIADAGNNGVRRVGPGGIITTIAGTGIGGYSGDGDLATNAKLNGATAVTVGSDGNLYIADYGNNRVRRVASLFSGVGISDVFIPSEDGSEVYYFTGSGRHIRTLDTLTGAAYYQFTYDGAYRLIAVTDSDGNVTTINRDTGDDPTAIVAPFGQRTTLTLNSNGYLASLANPAGETYQFSYTDDGLLTFLTDPKSFLHTFTYEGLGLLTKDEDPAGGSMSLSRSEVTNGYQVAVTTALGHSTNYLEEQLSTGDRRHTVTFPDGTKNISLEKTDGSTALTLPDGTAVNSLQGPDPRFGMQSPLLKSMTVATPAGLTMNVAQNRTVTLTNPTDLLSLSTLTDTVTRNGQAYTLAYVAATRSFTLTTPVGRQNTAKIDSLGRIVEEKFPGLNALQYSYDAQGRLSGITQGSGAEARAYTFQYNPQGYPGSITDSLSNVLAFEYDQAGRVNKQTLPDGGELRYSYDSNGNPTSITPPGRPAHAFSYSAVDLLTEYAPPDVGPGSGPTQYTYNTDRQITQISKPDGQTIGFNYDTGGRLGSIVSPDGSMTYTYDPAKGYLTGITWPGGNSLSYAHDGILTTGETWGGDVSGSVSRTFDSSFRVTAISINGANTTSYQYDNDSLLTTAGNLTLTRSAQTGFLTGTTLGNVTDAWTYNSFGEPVSYIARYNAGEILNQQLTYDKLGRISQKTEAIGGSTDTYDYTYDPVGRLLEVKKNGTVTSSYTYDGNGNRLTGPGGTTTYTYDAQDRLVTQSSVLGTQSYSYSANGELKSKTLSSQTTQYSYDALGNLKRVDLPSGIVVEYTVDAKGRRTGKKLNGAWERKFLYLDQLKPIAELDGSNVLVSRFIYGSQTVVPQYMVKGATTYRIISDPLGSPRLVVDTSNGTVAQRMDYDEFGNVVTDTNPGFQPFGFAGGLYEAATGLVHFGARDYDGETGRWTAKDPLLLYPSGSANTYEYVLSDPVNLIDPQGTNPNQMFFPSFSTQPTSCGPACRGAEKLLNWDRDMALRMRETQPSMSPGGKAVEEFFRKFMYPAALHCLTGPLGALGGEVQTASPLLTTGQHLAQAARNTAASAQMAANAARIAGKLPSAAALPRTLPLPNVSFGTSGGRFIPK